MCSHSPPRRLPLSFSLFLFDFRHDTLIAAFLLPLIFHYAAFAFSALPLPPPLAMLPLLLMLLRRYAMMLLPLLPFRFFAVSMLLHYFARRDAVDFAATPLIADKMLMSFTTPLLLIFVTCSRRFIAYFSLLLIFFRAVFAISDIAVSR